MGYTHYWQNGKQIPEAAMNNIRDILAEHDNILEVIKVGEHEVCFNGIGDEGHETFYYSSEKSGFAFCKTARKPYDIVVCKALIVLQHYCDIALSSDGFQGDFESWTNADEVWVDALAQVKKYIGGSIKRNITKLVGTCASCSSDNLTYAALEIEEDGITYPYACEDCGHSGREYHEVSFLYSD